MSLTQTVFLAPALLLALLLVKRAEVANQPSGRRLSEKPLHVVRRGPWGKGVDSGRGDTDWQGRMGPVGHQR